MNTLTIGGVAHEINDEVASLVLLISEERDGLKEALKSNKEPLANVLCSDGLALSLENITTMIGLASYGGYPMLPTNC